MVLYRPNAPFPQSPHPLVLTSPGSCATLLSSWDFPHHSREMHRFFLKSLIFFFLILSLVLLKHFPLNSQQHPKLLILNQSCDYGHPWCCHRDCTITSVVTARLILRAWETLAFVIYVSQKRLHSQFLCKRSSISSWNSLLGLIDHLLTLKR